MSANRYHLCINIGNTNIWFEYHMPFGNQTIKISTTSDTFTSGLKAEWLQNISCILVASVVPRMTIQLISEIRSICTIPVKLIRSRDYKRLKKVHYNEGELGVDRLMVIEGALSRFNPPFIVADFGTATTINIVDEKAEFLGGMILPGFQLSTEALSQRTGQLPNIHLSGQATMIPNRTTESIRSGVILSAVYTLERISEELGYSIIITGGNAPYAAPYFEKDVLVREQLLIEGMREVGLDDSTVQEKKDKASGF